MSWGAIDCISWGDCTIATVKGCNKACVNYEGGKVDVGDTPSMGEQPISAPQLIRSPFNRFDIKKEVVILHGSIFEIQSVSPKKVVLKLKKALTKGMHDLNTTMIDGVFIWVQDEVPIDAKKVMRESRIEVKQKGEQK